MSPGARESSAQDSRFRKYAVEGAYHWREVGRHWIHHQAFTAERYRRALAALGPLEGRVVLDYGCGDGALTAWIARRSKPREVHGYDPNPEGIELCRQTLRSHAINATIHDNLQTVPSDHFDAVVCADVIEHVHDPEALLAQIARALRPGGRAVITTPVRLTERPEDVSHVREWFPDHFREWLSDGPLVLRTHETQIPAAATEVYFWRPRFLLRAPVFRLLCNLLSIYFDVNALSWLALRPKLFMLQLAVLEKPAAAPPSR
jgi:SAM-dependent methyltransferase